MKRKQSLSLKGDCDLLSFTHNCLLHINVLTDRKGPFGGESRDLFLIILYSEYNGIRFNSKIRYNVNLVCTKKSADRVFFHSYSHFILQKKHTFCVFVRIASPSRF